MIKTTKNKVNPDSKNLVQNPDPGGGGGGGKVDDPILTFEQKNRLDIERYEAYCAKSSFLHKKFVPKNLARKSLNQNVQKTADSEIVLDKAIFNTRNFLLTGWSAAFFYLFTPRNTCFKDSQ